MAPTTSGGAISRSRVLASSGHTNANDPDGVVRIQLNQLTASHSELMLSATSGVDQVWIEGAFRGSRKHFSVRSELPSVASPIVARMRKPVGKSALIERKR
jgi:hypothetical protein